MRRIIKLVLLISVVSSIMIISAITVSATEIVDEGKCGDNLTWTLDDEGTLIISGSGSMYSYAPFYPPWNKYKDNITSVIIGDEVSSIKDAILTDYTSLRSLTCPASICSQICIYAGDTPIKEFTVTGRGGFSGDQMPYGLTTLEKVVISDGIRSIMGYPFTNCTSLNEIIIPTSLEKIYAGAFTGCTSLKELRVSCRVKFLGGESWSPQELEEDILWDCAANIIRAQHQWNDEYTVDKEPTCSEEGIESKHCSLCDAINEDSSRSISTTSHQFGEWTVTEEATCTTDGSKERKCTVCGYKEVEPIESLGHYWDDAMTIDTPTTCTNDGSQSIHCTRCNEIKDSQVIPMQGHKWTHVKNAAGLLKNGSEYDQCTVCKAKKNVKTLNGYATYYVKSFKVAKAKKAFTAKWKKQSKANQKKFNGYQIRYSTKSNMSGAKTTTAAKSSKSKKINKLKAKTKYYVQVRTYTKSGGKTFYSKWSAKKSVKTK